MEAFVILAVAGVWIVVSWVGEWIEFSTKGKEAWAEMEKDRCKICNHYNGGVHAYSCRLRRENF